MLQHVAANQMRFITPGLTADPRGVALGRSCLVLLPSLDRVVGLLRGMSREMSIDDLRPGLTIEQVATPLKSRELVVILPVRNSHAADQVAAVAGLNGGITFTGTARHFVQFRDSRSPLGYDVLGLEAGAGDYVLYANDFVQSYTRARELPLDRLVMGLSLAEVHGDALVPGEEAVLRVEQGLWRPVMSYLHRYRRPCAVACCDARAPTDSGGETARIYLMRTELEPRMEALFRGTPGVGVYRLLNDNIAVQLGHRHPVELTSVRGLFPASRFFLFSAQPAGLEVVGDDPRFVDAADLVRLGQDSQEAEVHKLPASAALRHVAVLLKLVPAPGVRREVKASRIPLRQADQLKKLVYLLPPRVLESTHIAMTEDEIFLLASGGLEFFPLGELHYELAPGVMAPLGFELIPRVHPDVLLGHLGSMDDPHQGEASLHFFAPGSAAPLRVPREAFVPLSRRVLARVNLLTAAPQDLPVPRPPATPELLNDPPGVFPLWGYRLDKDS